MTKALDEMLDSRDAELVIPKDSRTVGGSASANDTTASYTFVPDGNGFTLTPDHAKQYLLPAVRVMPTDGRTASNWFYILQQMPQMRSCRPSRWTPPWTLPNRNARLAMPFTRRRSTCTTTPSLRRQSRYGPAGAAPLYGGVDRGEQVHPGRRHGAQPDRQLYLYRHAAG